jgi:HAD superfamily hydrolase (TIGR01509 family)
MLVIFDCDGVLVDSEPIAARVTNHYLCELGHPGVDVANERFVGLRLDSMRKIIEADTGVPLPDNFENELRRRDAIAFENDLQPIAGIADVLTALRAPRCVASSGSQKKIRNSLTLTGLLEYFDPHLFSAQDPHIVHGKPAPDLFLHVAKSMGAEPLACVVIEDAVPGVQAGKAAGMRVLGFMGGGHCGPGHDAKLIDAGADKVFDDMSKLLDLI